MQARSLQICTLAPVVFAASFQRNVGRCEVVIAVESGPTGRGAIGRQLPKDSAKPGLQVKPQVVPSQVAVEFAGGAHGEHEAPQLLMLLSSTQSPLHAW